MLFREDEVLFHLNRLNRKFLPRDDLGADTSAARTGNISAVGMIFPEAGHALQFSRGAADVQACAFSGGASCDVTPYCVNDLIGYILEFADNETQAYDASPIRAVYHGIKHGLNGGGLYCHFGRLDFTLSC